VAEPFPLPRSSFKLLRLILIGYLHEGGRDRKASGPTDISRAIGLDPTLVSRNNAPLAALGLLESAESRRWRLTDGGVEVARALEYDAESDLREALFDIFKSNAYIQRVATFVRAQGGVDESEVVFHMARTAGVKRTSEFLTGARALLELMYAAGLVEHDGDTVRIPPPRREATTADRRPEKPTKASEIGIFGAGGIGYRLEPEGTAPGVTLHLNLSPADLKTDAAADQLAARIKRLLDALRS
jgi:hypothetical protein